MALGFGFNKQKVLAAAEKAVQQGKLQNAINEYEKVVKEDPKDLTVLNTIGDLHARVGNNDKAAIFFKRVGDIYATEGFTVKAIAVYKKITKLNPNATECLQKLAELYTQQGLYNDAKQQYMLVADSFMKGANLEDAARAFQKILELDTDNTAMQGKLADLFMKLGRKDDARNIYLTAAQGLYQKGALDAAEEALKKVISLDPKNEEAHLLRGKIASDSGDSAKAVKHLENLPDLETRPDALRALMMAHIQEHRLDEADKIANKLMNQHNDPSGLSSYAEAVLAAGQVEPALKIYDKYYDKLLAGSPTAVIQKLISSMDKLTDNAPALEMLRGIFVKAGEHTRMNEINEALAHACVQCGQLEKASGIYKELSELEPENPLHMQNYKQVQGKLGKDPTVREISKEAGMQALMVDELEHQAPVVQQDYPDPIRNAVKAAVTEAELFESYNMPMKAIAPLEAVLPQAPQDIQVNQRLASLYARSGRLPEAIQCCNVLQRVYSEAGFPDQAARYREMAGKYDERMDAAARAASVEIDASFMPGGGIAEPGEAAGAIAQPREFKIQPTMGAAPVAQAASPAMGEFNIEMTHAEPPPPVAAGAAAAHEIDLSDWEQMTSVEEPAAAAAAAAASQAAAAPAPTIDKSAELVQEAEFYLSQSMWREAEGAINNLRANNSNAPQLPGLREKLAAGLGLAAAAAAQPQGTVAEFAIDVVPEPTVEAPPPPPPPPAPKPVAAPPPPKPVPVVEAPKPAPVAAAAAAAPAKPAPPKPEKKKDALADFVLELDESLGEDFAVAAAPPSAKPAPAAARPSASASTAKAAASAAAPKAAPAPAPISAADASATLSDMFAEFKEDVEEGADQAEDPDTHYNLGVAFKEMGLLDEAIGELQKVCHAIEKGHPFSQVMQAYTWLAHCFLEKGAPEASVKWYEKALHVPSIDEESKMAVYYELGSAHEAAGNKKAALASFNEVYSNNIDYRDVAERIKALRS